MRVAVSAEFRGCECPSVTTPSFKGTLKSTRMKTRFAAEVEVVDVSLVIGFETLRSGKIKRTD